MKEASSDKTQTLTVLVVEDDDSLRSAISLNLEQHGYLCRLASNAGEAAPLIKSEAFDIVVCDHHLPGMDGLAFIKACRERDPEMAIILMTAFGNAELAIEAMRAGAYDYLSKPFTVEELILTLRKVEERERLRAENAELRSVIEQKYNFSNILARSDCMLNIFETVKRIANFNTTVLISGESGTGKELLARAIHYNSPRRTKPFVAVNCGAIPENLMESELFGHQRGAFTDANRDRIGLFEEADHGTIFLDEIGEMPPHLQGKLLRVLQQRQIQRVGDEKTREIDVRVITATLRDLEDDIKSGRFRDDLFYRLNVISISIPPLRERTEDIPVLADFFLKKHNKRLGINIKRIEPEALKCLVQYPWRGNVRELENCIERALVLTESNTINLDALPEAVRKCLHHPVQPMPENIDENNISIKQRVRALEKDLIVKALARTAGNRTHAAKILEISHRALLYKLKEYGLEQTGKKG